MLELTLMLLSIFILKALYVFFKDLSIYIKASELYENENKGKKYADLESLSEESMSYWYRVTNKKK